MKEKSSLKLQRFFGKFREINYQRGELILRAGEEPEGVYYLKKGNVKLYLVSESGLELNLNIFKPGSYFPMMWAIGKMENEYNYEAMGEVVVQLAPEGKVAELLRSDAEVLYELSERIIIGLGGLVKRMEQILLGSARARVAGSVAMLAKRFGEERGRKIKVMLSVSHQDIAALAGLTRETTSVEMMKLKREGLIDYERKRVAVRDFEKLKKEAER